MCRFLSQISFPPAQNQAKLCIDFSLSCMFIYEWKALWQLTWLFKCMKILTFITGTKWIIFFYGKSAYSLLLSSFCWNWCPSWNCTKRMRKSCVGLRCINSWRTSNQPCMLESCLSWTVAVHCNADVPIPIYIYTCMRICVRTCMPFLWEHSSLTSCISHSKCLREFSVNLLIS